MSTVISTFAAQETNVSALYGEKPTEKKGSAEAKEQDSAAATVELSDEAKSTGSQNAVQNGLSFANGLKNSLGFAKAYFMAGKVKGIGPGNLPGVAGKTNFVIDPAYLAKLADSEEEQEKFTESVSFLYEHGLQFERQLNAGGRKVVSQGWFCDKDGNWGGWTVTAPINKPESLTGKISKKIKEIKETAQERREKLAALEEKRAERQAERTAARDEAIAAQKEKSPDDYLSPEEKILKEKLGEKFLGFKEMHIDSQNGEVNMEHLRKLNEAMIAYRNSIMPGAAAFDGEREPFAETGLNNAVFTMRSRMASQWEKRDEALDAYIKQLEDAGVDFSRMPLASAYRDQRAAEKAAAAEGRSGEMQTMSADALTWDAAAEKAEWNKKIPYDYFGELTALAEGYDQTLGAATMADRAKNFLRAYADIYEKLVQGHQDGTWERYMKDENSETGYRKMTLEEEIAQLDAGLKGATRLFEIFAPIMQFEAGNKNNASAENPMLQIAEAWKSAYATSGSKDNAIKSVSPLIDKLFPDPQAAEEEAEAEKAKAADENEAQGKSTVAFNAAKRARQLAAAKTKAQVQMVMELLNTDLEDCKAGLEKGWCDQAEVDKVEEMIRQAQEKMSKVEDRAATAADEANFAAASLM